MSVLIKGMDMPKKKNGAVIIIYPDGRCAFENGKEYKAVPVPPHGRLIDADALLADVRAHSESYFADDFAHEWVDVAPTIIPADKDGES